MRKLITGAAAAALLLPAAGMAGGPPKGSITGYANLASVDFGNGADDDGTGFGVRGWFGLNPNWFLHGEYQTAETDDFEIPLDQLRAGGGYAGSLGGSNMFLAYAEYVDLGDFDSPGFDQSGFGVHGGVILGAGSTISGYGTVGYLTTDDTDGLEIDVGMDFMLNEQWGLNADYRTYLGSVDPSGDIDISSLRLGVSFTFY